MTPTVPVIETDNPTSEMTYLEQYAPAWVAEVLELCGDIDEANPPK